MSSIQDLRTSIDLVRREIKNIRQEVLKQKSNLKSEVEKMKSFLSMEDTKKHDVVCNKNENKSSYQMTPIGYISSCFKNKNGIPRQPSLCRAAKATLEIDKTFFTNPEHALIGLNEFSYIWILFVFHKNNETSVKSKVHPPRLHGTSVGVFSTRSPHRPCAIGLSLVKLDKIIGSTLLLSGVDMLDGTPVLDIKPYIPSYDDPNISTVAFPHEENLLFKDGNCGDNKYTSENDEYCAKCTDGCDEESDSQIHISLKKEEQNTEMLTNIASLLSKPSNILEVIFNPRALSDLENFHSCASHEKKCKYCLTFLQGSSEAKEAITQILQNDPRSVYRKKKCLDKLYYFEMDSLHITCWFDNNITEVLRVKPSNDSFVENVSNV